MADEIEQRITIGPAGLVDLPFDTGEDADGVEVLHEDDGALALALALPRGATLDRDGSVVLILDYPVTIKFRKPGNATPIEQAFNQIRLHRLHGSDMRRVLDAKGRAATLALALSAHMTEAKIALLQKRMDASDVSAASSVVAALCGFSADSGLPENAEITPEGAVRLKLVYPVEPEGFEPRDELMLRRLTGEDLQAISQAKDTLITAIARGTGMTPREANAVFDAMDALDIMGAQRVVGFLSGNGRTTGR